MNILINLIRFSRLHTVVGTSLSIVALYFMALSSHPGSDHYGSLLVLTLVSCLGANIYIVGLNQITDIDIDKINKPYLPLASGVFSRRFGLIIIITSILLSLIIGFYLGKYLLLTVLLSLFLGTIYSLPPIRLKRFPFWAAFCIVAVRGVIVNIFLFLHFNSWINQTSQVTSMVLALTATIFIYSIIIAWFKDIPDMEGDRKFNISTFSIRFGAERIFLLGNILLSLTFLTLIVFAYFNPNLGNRPLMMGSHFLFFIALIYFSKKTDIKQPQLISKYYQFIWVLFFGEYIVFATSQLLN
ncbi:MAG: homogentisate phytyltransferase [Saprospiraceae bacterium]